MRFSLITATLGRVEEVRCLCVSLSKQTFKDFELYIVDQNEHHEPVSYTHLTLPTIYSV